MSELQRLLSQARARTDFAHRGIGFGNLVASNESFQHVLLIAVFALVLRLPYFNNPAIYIDEQFYMLVADRWLHEGMIPYVDIWDRKPLGIFIVYAAGQLFGDPILGYQLLALFCVIGTALLIWAMTARVWTRTVGLYAAMFYCVSIMLMDGQGGQSPVFYNLPVAAAAYLLLGLSVERGRRDKMGAALSAAVLLGIALQIKYTAVFEAVALSLFGLVALSLRHGWGLARIAVLAVAMAALGIAPTALVGAWYAAIGHWQAFFFANFLSIFAKSSWQLRPAAYLHEYWRASLAALQLLVPAAFLSVELILRRVPVTTAERWTLAGVSAWLGMTFAGAILMGKPAMHYFLPTLLPLSILAAVALHRVLALGTLRQVLPRWPSRADAPVVFAALIGFATVASFSVVLSTENHWGNPSLITESAETIKDRLHGRCLYVFNRLPIYYYLTQSCLPTRYPFPNHLSDSAELHALPDDALPELARVLATKPALLVRIPITSETDPAAEEMLNQALARDYVLDQMFVGERQTINLYLPRARH